MRLGQQRGFAGGGFGMMPTHSVATKAAVSQALSASRLLAWTVLARCRRDIPRVSSRSA
jgi:hypothetical protein